MFDPENVGREEACEFTGRHLCVSASDYDQLLALYSGLLKAIDDQCSIGCLHLPKVRPFAGRPENGQEEQDA